MKAIALTQPWAELVAGGEKQIETRHWGTAYRGPIAIYAAKGLNGLPVMRPTEDHLAQQCGAPHFKDALAETTGRLGQSVHRVASSLPRGAFVAVAILANVTDARPMRERLESWRDEPPADRNPNRAERELAFGNYGDGRKAWQLDDIHRIEPLHPELGEIKTFQGLFWTPRTVDDLILDRLTEETGMVSCWHEFSREVANQRCVQCALEYEMMGPFS